MNAFTEWEPEARTATFSFYLTAHFCTSRTADALSAAHLADAITIAGPKGPDAANVLRNSGVTAPILFDGTGYKDEVSLAADDWVDEQQRAGALHPLLPGAFLP